jgi:two-component system copper resistance phosphate regulon response regulator CusR
MKILLVDDDLQMASTVKDLLSGFFTVETCSSGVEGESIVYSNDYDLVILDVLLGDGNGIEICRKIRENNYTMPILVLSGKAELENKVRALNYGADDYITKPFYAEELIARIRALLRRQKSGFAANTLSVGDLTLDLEKRKVARGKTVIPLRRKEFSLLEYLIRNEGRVMTRDMILDHLWESDTDSLTNIVDVHIKYLRDQLDKPYKKKLIKTVHGIGYKIEA